MVLKIAASKRNQNSTTTTSTNVSKFFKMVPQIAASKPSKISWGVGLPIKLRFGKLVRFFASAKPKLEARISHGNS